VELAIMTGDSEADEKIVTILEHQQELLDQHEKLLAALTHTPDLDSVESSESEDFTSIGFQ
jgi:hypothetical protein